MVRLGLALRIKAYPFHRALILSDTKHDDDFVVLVRVTTDDGDWSDQACILTRADWPNLDHQSTVAYSTAVAERVKQQLERSIRDGSFREIPSPPFEVLQRICRIGRTYKGTPPIAKQHIAVI